MTWSRTVGAWLRPISGGTARLLRCASAWAALLRHAGAALLVASCGFGFGLWYQPPPVTTLDVHEANRAVVRGGVLYLSVTVDQHRACVTAVRRWLWRWDPADAKAMDFAYLYGVPFRPPTLIGIDRYILGIPVPSWIEAGDWYYAAELQDDCSWWRRWLWPTTHSPDVPVRIEDPTPANPAQVVAPDGAVTVLRSDQKPQQ